MRIEGCDVGGGWAGTAATVDRPDMHVHGASTGGTDSGPGSVVGAPSGDPARVACAPPMRHQQVSHAHHRRREPTRPLPSTASRTKALGRCPDLLEPIPDAGRHLCGTRHTPQLDQQPICAPSRGAWRRCDVRGAIDTILSPRARSDGSATSMSAMAQDRVKSTCDGHAAMSSSQSGSSRFPGIGGRRDVQGSR